MNEIHAFNAVVCSPPVDYNNMNNDDDENTVLSSTDGSSVPLLCNLI